MGYRCGNCNMDFQTKKEWLDHQDQVHDSHFMEGDAESIAYHKAKLEDRATNGNTASAEKLKKFM